MAIHYYLRMRNIAFLLVFVANILLTYSTPVLGSPTDGAADLNKQVADARAKSGKEVAEILVRSKTLVGFVDKISGTIGAEPTTFLRQKIKGQENTRMKVDQLGPNKFIIYIDRSITRFVIGEMGARTLTLEINNRPITLDLSQPLNELWDQLGSKFPKSASHGMNLFVSEAQANPMAFRILGVEAAIAGAGFFYASRTNCQTYELHGRTCSIPLVSDSMLFDAAAFDQSWRTFAIGCSDKKDALRKCLQDRIKERKIEVPDNLKEYFNQAVPSKSKGKGNAAP